MNTNYKSEMQKIAEKMAIRFDKYFTPKDLILWNIQASGLLSQHTEDLTLTNEYCHGSDFLSSFEYTLLPPLLNVKSNKERRAVIKRELPELFSGMLYSNLKKALAEIGNAFILDYSKLTWNEYKIHAFMQHLSCFMELSEMYSHYEFYEQEQWKEEEKTKVA